MYVNADGLIRSLPDIPEVLAKIQSGEYTIWGGVVRHTAGTEKGGQIVGHLLFPSDPLQTQQALQNLQNTISKSLGSLQEGMEGLQKSMNVLQGLQAANLVMTGLNLAVTTAGFVIVCQKLNKISAQIEAQSIGIAQTLSLVGDVHERNLLRDEAKFRSLLFSSQQFCENGDVDQLKNLIPMLHQEYQFTKLVLSKHASIGSSSVERLSEIVILQDRLVNIGMMMSHVQMKSGAAKQGSHSLTQLSSDLGTLNAARIKALSSNRNVAATVSAAHFAALTSFLKDGSAMVPALNYQADVIELESRHPGLAQKASESKEILLVAA